MITTLKELKANYPGLITTSGNTYYIDGMGWYRQKKTIFGLETYTKHRDESWGSTSFEELVKYIKQIHG